MKHIRALIDKETLLYIVQGKRVSKEYIIRNCKCRPDQLECWLNAMCDSYPTITQAKNIASCLHIPFAALYMDKKDIKLGRIPRAKNMRTLPDSEAADESLMNIILIDILNERDFLIQARKELGITSEPFCVDTPVSNDPKAWADIIRKYFELDINIQFSCHNTKEFFLYLRSQIEKKGIFIHCFKNVDIEMIRGIAIFDQTMPMIGINVKDRHPARSFSIIHEIVHLLKRQSSVCNDMYNSFSAQQEEVFCNAVAGELLVPTDIFQNALQTESSTNIEEIKVIVNLAKQFSVSKEVIIRRMYESGVIDREQYTNYADQFKMGNEEENKKSETEKAPRTRKKVERDMSKAIIDRTSSAICQVLYKGFCEDIYDEMDISNYLELSLDHVDSFLKEVAKWDS